MLSLAAVAALGGCKKKEGAEKAPAAAPTKVKLATATEAQVPKRLVLTGMVVAKQRSEVTADTQGKVLNVMVERGSRVKAGDPVVQLDTQNAALGAREAQANLANARAQRELAEQECVRTKQLFGQGAITRSEYDRQITQCTSALQSVSAAEARTALVVKSVRDGVVRAPFAGVVAEKSVSPGEYVSPGRALFTLVEDDPLRIELSVPEAEVSAVKLDQLVELKAVAQPDKLHRAKVTRIGAEIGRTRSLIVEATLDPGSGLVPGMFAEAHLTIGEVARPVVPKDAVVKRGKIQHAFVVVDGEVRDQIVQTAESGAPDTIAIVSGIPSGVKKGDKVVVKEIVEKDGKPAATAITEKVGDGLRVVE